MRVYLDANFFISGFSDRPKDVAVIKNAADKVGIELWITRQVFQELRWYLRREVDTIIQIDETLSKDIKALTESIKRPESSLPQPNDMSLILLTPFLETNTEQLLDCIASPVSSAASRFSIAEIITNRLPRFIYYIWREYYLLVLGGIIGVVIVKDKIIRRFILIGLLSTFVVAMMRYAREYEVYFLPFYVFFIILIGYGLDWLTNRLRLQKGLVLLAFIIPILLIGLNYSRVDHHNRILWARITEKVLNTVKEDAVILAPNYDNATFPGIASPAATGSSSR